MNPVLCPSGDGIQTTSSPVICMSAAATRTLKLVVCSVCMIALGVASVPDVKISSDTAAASRSGIGPKAAPRASTSSIAMPTDGDRSHTTCTGFTPVRGCGVGDEPLVVEVAVRAGSEDRAGPCGLEDVRKLAAPVVREQRVDHRARRQDSERHHGGLEAVRQLDRHDVAGTDVLLAQEAGDRGRASPQVPVGEVGAVLVEHGARASGRAVAWAATRPGSVVPSHAPDARYASRRRSGVTRSRSSLTARAAPRRCDPGPAR